MHPWFVRSLVVALAVTGFGIVDAAGPGGTTVKKKSGLSKTVTTTVLTADLTLPDEFDTPAGVAEYKTVTVTCTTWCSTSTTTTTTLTFSLYGLDLADGTEVVYEFNEDEVNFLGSSIVNSGKTTLRLSSKQGATIPVIQEGDNIDIEDPTDTSDSYVAIGYFGPPVTTVTTCGK